MAFFSLPEDETVNDDDETGNGKKRRQISSTQKLLRRKQISRDLYGPDQVDFFDISDDDEGRSNYIEGEETLFFPLRYAPRAIAKTIGQGHGGHGGHVPTKPNDTEEKDEWSDEEIQYKDFPEESIKRATINDFMKTGILFLLMVAFVGVCIGWKTHEDESHSIFGPVGLACVTPCYGDREYRNFFVANHDHFHSGDVSLMK